jgi:DNA-binding transcriptional LysR family regulator
MAQRPGSINIDLHLVRVLHTVIAERSVSRAALKLQATQPVVSAQLKRLRTRTQDPLLVRSGGQLVPTDGALAMLSHAESLLREADHLFAPKLRAGAKAFDAATSEATFHVAASDYLDPLFLPGLVQRVRAAAPGVKIELHPLSAEYDYRAKLARGEVDLVIGNWMKPPEELHLGRLASDEIVCLVAADHPAVRQQRQARGWTLERYLDSDHVAPTALHAATAGVIDEQLALRGLTRRVVARAAHFSLIPLMVARTNLVLTTGRQFCSRYLNALPVQIVRCPVPFDVMNYYQLWHERTHASAACTWLRDQVRALAVELRLPGAPVQPRKAR